MSQGQIYLELLRVLCHPHSCWEGWEEASSRERPQPPLIHFELSLGSSSVNSRCFAGTQTWD